MTDEQFKAELRIRSYIDQIDGYPLGHPARANFRPIIAVLGTREATLDLPQYSTFTPEQRILLLKRDEEEPQP